MRLRIMCQLSWPAGRAAMQIEAVDFFCLSMPVVTAEADGSQDALLVRVAAVACDSMDLLQAAHTMSGVEMARRLPETRRPGRGAGRTCGVLVARLWRRGSFGHGKCGEGGARALLRRM
jgi:hypothetical protein